MKDRSDDWDELAINKNRNRRKKSRRKNSKPLNQDEIDDRDFVGSLETSSGKYEWMKEKRYKSIFRDIENKIQGAMGKGCLLYTSPSPRDGLLSRMPSSA